jgi:hypothetical protein
MEQSFNWIKSAISTSVSEFHLDCCKILIKLFTDKYKEESHFAQAYGELMEDLINKETFLIIEV